MFEELKVALTTALTAAEIRISKFQAPSIPSATDLATPDMTFDIAKIQEQTGKYSGEQRIDAIYQILITLITKVCDERIARNSKISEIDALKSEIASIKAILQTNSI